MCFKNVPTGSSWGFDTYVGGLHGGGGHYSKTLTAEGVKDEFYDYGRAWGNGTYKLEHDDRHSTHSFTSEAITLFEDHKASGKADPLFLYLAYTAPHTPLQAEPQWLEKCQHIQHSYRRAYCGLVYGADEGIRNVTEAAKRLLGLNTLVMVTSDNGACAGAPFCVPTSLKSLISIAMRAVPVSLKRVDPKCHLPIACVE